MRRHRHARGVVRHTRLDGVQGPLTGIERRGRAAEAVERFFRIEVALVVAIVVGLPELQERVAHQVAVAVIDIAEHQDVLARGVSPRHAVPDLLVAGRVAGGLQGQADVHVGAGGLRRGFRQQFDRHGAPPQQFSKWVLRCPRNTMSKR
ncbi:hypothetical protein D3C80_927930 [compost metagenome]